MKVKSESEVAQWCLTLSDPMDCSLPGSSVHGIFQGRVLEWVANLEKVQLNSYKMHVRNTDLYYHILPWWARCVLTVWGVMLLHGLCSHKMEALNAEAVCTHPDSIRVPASMFGKRVA